MDVAELIARALWDHWMPGAWPSADDPNVARQATRTTYLEAGKAVRLALIAEAERLVAIDAVELTKRRLRAEAEIEIEEATREAPDDLSGSAEERERGGS